MPKKLFAPLAALALCLALCLAAAAAPANQSRGMAKVNGVELSYRLQGAGEPLLLITGYSCTMDSWDAALLEGLAHHHRLIIFDNRGMGASTIDGRELSIAMMADDAAGLLEALGLGRADVLGWSMGGMIAQELALARPELVGKLVLYGSFCRTEQLLQAMAVLKADKAKPLEQRLFPAEWLKTHPDPLARLPHEATPPSKETAARQAKAIMAWPGTADRLPGLAKPVLLLVGQSDEISPPQCSLEMASLIPGSWLARFVGGGHFLQYQAPRAMARTVEAFLQTPQDLTAPGN